MSLQIAKKEVTYTLWRIKKTEGDRIFKKQASWSWIIKNQMNIRSIRTSESKFTQIYNN